MTPDAAPPSGERPGRLPSCAPSGPSARKEVVLSGRVAPDALREASALFASCLATLGRRAERILRAERREIRHALRRRALERHPAVRSAPDGRAPQGQPSPADAADLRACERSLRRVARIGRHPLPQAGRQMRRLAALLEGGEFRSLRVSERAVVACVVPAKLHPRDRDVPAFEICFVPGDRQHAPIMIRLPGSEVPNFVFLRLASHGACRGGATPLLETAEEQADAHRMFLVAFTWAFENLGAPCGRRTDVVRG